METLELALIIGLMMISALSAGFAIAWRAREKEIVRLRRKAERYMQLEAQRRAELQTVYRQLAARTEEEEETRAGLSQLADWLFDRSQIPVWGFGSQRPPSEGEA